DWLHIDDLLSAPYNVVYLPYPIHLTSETARTLREWVERGGTLISEGCPAYFGDRGRAGTVQPNLGLDELFGAREQHVEFTPDISDDVTFSFDAGGAVTADIPGALHLQAYAPTTGRAAGVYKEGYGYAGAPGGLPAVVEHTFGQGRTLLIGTSPGAARHRAATPIQRRHTPAGTTYHSHQVADLHGASPQDRHTAAQSFFAALLTWASVTPHVRTSVPAIIARLHHDPDANHTFLWSLNPTREPHETTLTIPATGQSLTLTIPARDAVITPLS
ncbi:MAG TPA: beta-galactosidase trimerization domain-containing protein, partial [Chloroflexota bacterium]|nr:beta-galactosidase trimerization domain-containing protein [Chloroflexota bacterium]